MHRNSNYFRYENVICLFQSSSFHNSNSIIFFIATIYTYIYNIHLINLQFSIYQSVKCFIIDDVHVGHIKYLNLTVRVHRFTIITRHNTPCSAMGRKKKPFIDKKKATTYKLVHRSQHDPLIADQEANQYVLKELPGQSLSFFFFFLI